MNKIYKYVLLVLIVAFISACSFSEDKYFSKEDKYIADISTNLFFVGKLDVEYENIKNKKLREIGSKYDRGQFFSDGVVVVEKDKKYGVVNENYKELIKPEFEYISAFREGVASFQREEKYKYGLLDYNGKILLDNKYDFIGSSVEGILIVEKDGKFGYMRKNGKLLTRIDFNYCRNFSEGLAVVKRESKFGYIDDAGNLKIGYDYDWAGDFSDGLAVVEKNGKCAYINDSGKVIIDYKYDYAEKFSEGLAVVKKNGKCGYINDSGKVIIDYKYDSAAKFSESKAVVSIEDKYYVIDKKGEILFEINKKYSPYGPFCSAYFEQGNLIVSVEKTIFFGHLYGLMNDKGDIVLKPQYIIIYPVDNKRSKGYVVENERGERIFMRKNDA